MENGGRLLLQRGTFTANPLVNEVGGSVDYQFATASSLFLENSIITNYGTFSFDNNGTFQFENSIFTNKVGGVVQFVKHCTVSVTGASPNQFINEGQITMAAVGSVLDLIIFEPTFINRGSFSLTSGSIQVTRPFEGASGSTVTVQGGSFRFGGSGHWLNGTLELSSGSIAGSGAVSVGEDGFWSWTGGVNNVPTFNCFGKATLAGATKQYNGNRLTFSGGGITKF